MDNPHLHPSRSRAWNIPLSQEISFPDIYPSRFPGNPVYNRYDAELQWYDHRSPSPALPVNPGKSMADHHQSKADDDHHTLWNAAHIPGM